MTRIAEFRIQAENFPTVIMKTPDALNLLDILEEAELYAYFASHELNKDGEQTQLAKRASTYLQRFKEFNEQTRRNK